MPYKLAKLRRESEKSSGATEHCLECNGQFNWINTKTLSTEQHYHRRKLRESLEIKKSKANRRKKVLSCDEGNLVKANTLTPVSTHYIRFVILSNWPKFM